MTTETPQDEKQMQHRARRARFVAATVAQKLTGNGKRDALIVWHAVEQHPMTAMAADELLTTWRQPYGLTVTEVADAIRAFLAEHDPLAQVRAALGELREQASSGTFTEPDDAAYFSRWEGYSGFIPARRMETLRLPKLIDRTIVRRLATDILGAGHGVAVYDGEMWTGRLTTLPEVMAAVMSDSEESLRVFAKDTHERLGTVMLVHGNAPSAVIDDYTQRPEMLRLVAGAVALAAAFREFAE